VFNLSVPRIHTYSLELYFLFFMQFRIFPSAIAIADQV